jgi:hypothetical protein
MTLPRVRVQRRAGPESAGTRLVPKDHSRYHERGVWQDYANPRLRGHDPSTIVSNYAIVGQEVEHTSQRGDSGNTRMSAARKTAGIIWMPRLVRHWPLLVGSKPTYVPVAYELSALKERGVIIPYEIQAAANAPTPNMNCWSAVMRPRISGCANSL